MGESGWSQWMKELGNILSNGNQRETLVSPSPLVNKNHPFQPIGSLHTFDRSPLSFALDVNNNQSAGNRLSKTVSILTENSISL